MSDQSTATPAGWFPDPLGRYDHRWYNGTTWTADVSVHGDRFVDPLPVTGPVGPATSLAPSSMPYTLPFGTPAGAPFGVHRPPSRTLAVLSLIAGLIAVTTGWMPLLFVIGAMAGIAAVVLGTMALRRVATGRARGKGMAIAGLVLGLVGLATCVIGVILTGALLREVSDYTEPGPTDVEVTSCVGDGRTVRMTGTIENLDGETHDYSIAIEIIDGRDVVERDNVALDDVAAGEVRSWDVLVINRADEPDEPECEISEVNGPFPFGLDPNP